MRTNPPATRTVKGIAASSVTMTPTQAAGAAAVARSGGAISESAPPPERAQPSQQKSSKSKVGGVNVVSMVMVHITKLAFDLPFGPFMT